MQQTDSRVRRHAATRREILAAAWSQADESGIAGISLRELAAAVGMRAPSLYTYFEGKDAIYDAMFAEGYTDLDAAMADHVAGTDHTDPLAALTGTAEAFIAFCQDSPARYQLMFTRAVPGWEPSSAAYAASLRSYERSAAGLAAFGISTELARDLYIAVVAGLAAQQMANEPTGDRWRGMSPDAMEMLLGYLGRSVKGTQ